MKGLVGAWGPGPLPPPPLKSVPALPPWSGGLTYAQGHHVAYERCSCFNVCKVFVNTFSLEYETRGLTAVFRGLHPGLSRATQPQRGPGNHYRGALSQPHSVCAENEETWGGVSPHHPTRGLGERRKLPQWGPGRSPSRKWIYAYLR